MDLEYLNKKLTLKNTYKYVKIYYICIIKTHKIMDHKQEALEIFRKFIIKHNGWSENEYTLNYTVEKIKESTFNTQWFAPKESAIFCVNKILETTNKREYYVKVLNEIKNF